MASNANLLVSPLQFSYDRRNGFHIQDRHQVYKRCDPKELHTLLIYDEEAAKYTKKGKLRKNPPRHTDPTHHFYSAQLTHYGLPSPTSKQAAKAALLEAYESEEGLTVPPHILQCEERLRAQYRAKEARLLEEENERWRRHCEKEEKQRVKRKRQEDDLVAEIEGATASKKKQQTDVKPLDIQKLAGSYIIVAPKISEGWNCQDPLQLKLALSSTAKHLWGTFNFDVFEGKMRSQSLDTPTTTNRTIRFHWRGRETGEGESTFGPENIAKFEFLPSGSFKGRMYWDSAGKFDIKGKLAEGGDGVGGLEGGVEEWKKGYWAITEANYNRECASRWGGWGGDSDDDEVEENSDTEREVEEDSDVGREDEEDFDTEREF
ncbi:MAG: hypothetical protein Q9180_004018 [Flavoplaca navasiana]